jgi:hypothetical protein
VASPLPVATTTTGDNRYSSGAGAASASYSSSDGRGGGSGGSSSSGGGGGIGGRYGAQHSAPAGVDDALRRVERRKVDLHALYSIPGLYSPSREHAFVIGAGPAVSSRDTGGGGGVGGVAVGSGGGGGFSVVGGGGGTAAVGSSPSWRSGAAAVSYVAPPTPSGPWLGLPDSVWLEVAVRIPQRDRLRLGRVCRHLKRVVMSRGAWPSVDLSWSSLGPPQLAVVATLQPSTLDVGWTALVRSDAHYPFCCCTHTHTHTHNHSHTAPHSHPHPHHLAR